ncbi:MAG: pyruvate, phosphate dikinase [Eubacteriales bacterium]|nr:pyruvate, phosphate dikinase [Eubacteriales bacterium]
MTKFVYLFKEGNASMRNLLGGKGANLAEMTTMGLPVPSGFTVTTEACNDYYRAGEQIAQEIIEEIFEALRATEEITGKEFGNKDNPLLVSVRSGARASMPGMMDTVLNLGLNDEVVQGLAKMTNNPRFAYDSYRRFIMMFSDVAMGIDKNLFERELEKLKEEHNASLDTDLSAEQMQELAEHFLEIYKRERGEDFPQDPKEQLILAITAVFRSWNNERAIYYRRMNNIPADWGTAVNVQEMVYGNSGENSGTGVAFTRNPATGENVFYGEYLMNAQGEDVVAGVRTPHPISHLEEQMPEVYKQFLDIAENLEQHYGDMQDLEFTIEDGKLFILQTRNGKRTATAALQIAVDMVEKGLISKEKALMQIDPKSLDTLLHPTFDQKALAEAEPIAKGLPASPGAAAGQIVFTADAAEAASEEGKKVILVRLETSPEDILGMNVSEGILTVRGGMTSHAAVVARGMGKCCVTGCSEIMVDEEKGEMKVKGQTLKEFDTISLNGSTGQVYLGEIPTVEAEMSGNFAKIMDWTDEVRMMNVRTNADTPHDAEVARELGAGGIGLVRTEHMFFDEDRIFAFRKMILAGSEELRRAALEQIMPMQKDDFVGIFKAMRGLNVTIRLLDPPLHEFLPTDPEEIAELAEAVGISLHDLEAKIAAMHELNPMLGHRGCRLAISYPEVAEMQAEAILRAAVEENSAEAPIVPEIMIPLVGDVKEFVYVKNYIDRAAERVFAELGDKVEYKVGTMLEIPRAALTSDQIAQVADFFSFGTNDLTQMIYGLSRDDAGPILDIYYKEGIYEADPTATIDRAGVGRLMRISAEDGRGAKPDLKLGICGEHGGDPASIELCHELDFDYVSCSPFRVPIAKLAAAQAQIKKPREFKSKDLEHALKNI